MFEFPARTTNKTSLDKFKQKGGVKDLVHRRDVKSCFIYVLTSIQVIPGNLQKYVSTNRGLLQCKTLPAHFSNNMMVYCLLNVT